jgi:hypothetical protein
MEGIRVVPCNQQKDCNSIKDCNEGIAEAYRQAIEVLWKFLEMYLKPDKMMSKNLHKVTIQIYAVLIFYLPLKLYAYGTATPIETPRMGVNG